MPAQYQLSASRSHPIPTVAWTPAGACVGILGGLLLGGRLAAEPAGLTVQSGTVSTAIQGSQLNITASHNSVLQWQSFNIGAGETTRFIQPSSSSVVWNRILDANPSQIHGRLEANGVVVLMNSSGFYFGPDSFVSAAGLIVSTAQVNPVEAASGLFWSFQGAPPDAKIANYGHLSAEKGGTLFLIGSKIENHGTLSAPEGRVGLLSGEEVLVSARPDGRSLSASVRLPKGTIDQTGEVRADAGTIALHAQVVNQDGLIQANSIQERNGIIELVASDSISLGSQSVLSARGDRSQASDGGRIEVISSGRFQDVTGSRVDISAGSSGGDGGHVEISAPQLSAIRSVVDGSAAAGKGGSLFIDPTDIIISNSGGGSAGNGNVGSGAGPTTLELDINTAFQGFSQIRLQATRNISITAGTIWDLVTSTGLSLPGSQLILEAGNNITVANGAGLLAGENWSVSLQAGRQFPSPDGFVSGTGSIVFSGAGFLQAQNGDVNLKAGNNITVGSGFVRTMAGGKISAEAIAGTINTGNKANGFVFRPGGYSVDTELGGISTFDGGNVSLKAGLDIISYLPIAGGVQTDAGSGAFGDRAGNVTIQAGRDVQGHYVVRNGDGIITAGRDAGVNARLLALSVVDGGWTVNAGRDVLLQEVRNPNGIFNNLGFASSLTKHFFDYSPDAYTVLNAVRGVQLRGTALPRYLDAFEQGITPIYPGRLQISAGSGGVQIGNDVTLFPSPQGALSITTTDGGSLVGTKAGDLTTLLMSDSGKTQYKSFGDFGLADHAATPVHSLNSSPVVLNINGDLSGILLGVPKKAEITVGRDMINSRFEGQNLGASDTTFIHVGRDIINRNEFTTVNLATAPDFGVFDLVYPPLVGGAAGVQSLFVYNPNTQELTFQGRMTGEQLQALTQLRVRTFDSFGFPIIGPDGEPVTAPAQFVASTVLNQLFTQSQDVPLNPDTGYRIGGGGLFEVQARNLDLGATVGIVSQGPRSNHALAATLSRGADIQIALTGNLDMFSTKIASIAGGDVSITANGSVRVGSRTFISNDGSARGIFTTDPSDVTVIARGDILVNGSRIAAYDGGNVWVKSLEGNVDAGTGGAGSATVEKIIVDPVTRQVLSYAPTIPGSGILATSFPRSLDPAFPASVNTVGDILVETPQGDIIASAGGVVQIPLNGIGSNLGTVTLRAGTKDANGNVIHVGNIDASGSGVIGSTVKLEATGDIDGIVFARQNIDLNAQQNVNVTALAQGSVNVGAGGSVSGTIIGVGSVNASGASVDASLLSQNISASGDVSSAQVGFSQGTAAASTSQSLQSEDKAATKLPGNREDKTEEELKGRRQQLPLLTRTVGRVTVILPTKP